MNRSYYAATARQFLSDSPDSILGALSRAHPFPVDIEQKLAWQDQVSVLKNALSKECYRDAYVFFEFAIPRMGKRVDVVLTLQGVVFAIEFKVGMTTYAKHAIDQAIDYCLDLKNFHEGSHEKPVVPVLTATEAPDIENEILASSDGLYSPLMTNKRTLTDEIEQFVNKVSEPSFDGEAWASTPYRPTPTIIEAAQALYKGHKVAEITRSDSGAENLTRTASEIDRIIRHSKETSEKAICFITGVPGSGKTLAGLNIANERHNIDEGEHAVFLSGNGPLVAVLREALTRDSVEQAKLRGEVITKKEAASKTSVFIQNIHHFRDEYLEDLSAPIERVAVFDEAQRAWTKEKAAQFMKSRKGIPDFQKSEPEFLIEVMDRHEGYAVIICLIGGGQEINTGEAGLPEWFAALSKRFRDWRIYLSEQLTDSEYTQGLDLNSTVEPQSLMLSKSLHLSVSVRSFRAETVSNAVKSLLDGETADARRLFNGLRETYPIYLVRDLDLAREWLKSQARGTERTGIVACSGALRLKPEGLNVKVTIDPVNWFLNDQNDVRSSFFLEDVATEFDVQGLELDWVCLAWDINFYRDEHNWMYERFTGHRWNKVNQEEGRRFLKNAYRVLLTRARQGMVIYVPFGSDDDHTRPTNRYESIASYLLECGVLPLPDENL